MNKAVEYLANQLYSIQSQKDGFAMSVRWRCLRAEVQEKYIVAAQGLINEWDDDEKNAEKNRKRIRKNIVKKYT